MSPTAVLTRPASPATPTMPDLFTVPPSAPLALPPLSEILHPDLSLPVPLPSATSADPDSDSETAPAPAFVVDSLDSADWVVARVLEAQARLDNRATLATELHSRIDTWLSKACADDESSIAYFMSVLRPWATSEIAKLHRSRTLNLPSGSLSLRRSPDQLSIDDPDAALAWASTHRPDAVITRTELSKSALRAIVLKDLAPVPGVTAALGADQLFVRAT